MFKGLKVLNDLQMARNFRLSEFACPGSDSLRLDMDLVEKLQKMRDAIGKPIKIVSGYRTEEYNRSIGGAVNSYHLKGMASDIKVKGMKPKEVAVVAEYVGFNGIGVYNHNGQSFVHVDVRVSRSYWKDQEGNKRLIKVDDLREIL